MTNAEARFSIALRPRKPEGSLGRTDQDVHLDSHTAPELLYIYTHGYPQVTHFGPGAWSKQTKAIKFPRTCKNRAAWLKTKINIGPVPSHRLELRTLCWKTTRQISPHHGNSTTSSSSVRHYFTKCAVTDHWYGTATSVSLQQQVFSEIITVSMQQHSSDQ